MGELIRDALDDVIDDFPTLEGLLRPASPNEALGEEPASSGYTISCPNRIEESRCSRVEKHLLLLTQMKVQAMVVRVARKLAC